MPERVVERVVVVTATPASAIVAPEPTWTPDPQLEQPPATPVPAPTAEPGPVVTYPPYLPPTPEPPEHPDSLHDQMLGCLSFTAERYTATAYTPVAVVVRVIAKNRCNATFTGSDAYFEARARATAPTMSGVSGRQVGNFQSPIGPYGEAETLVQIDGLRPDSETYAVEASLWWAAGGGRKAGN